MTWPLEGSFNARVDITREQKSGFFKLEAQHDRIIVSVFPSRIENAEAGFINDPTRLLIVQRYPSDAPLRQCLLQLFKTDGIAFCGSRPKF
jgi:hypothetical protein